MATAPDVQKDTRAIRFSRGMHPCTRAVRPRCPRCRAVPFRAVGEREINQQWATWLRHRMRIAGLTTSTARGRAWRRSGAPRTGVRDGPARPRATRQRGRHGRQHMTDYSPWGAVAALQDVLVAFEILPSGRGWWEPDQKVLLLDKRQS